MAKSSSEVTGKPPANELPKPPVVIVPKAAASALVPPQLLPVLFREGSGSALHAKVCCALIPGVPSAGVWMGVVIAGGAKETGCGECTAPAVGARENKFGEHDAPAAGAKQKGVEQGVVGAPRFCHAVPTCSIDDVVVSAKGNGVDDAGAWDDVGAGALSVAAVCTSNTHQRTLKR